MARVHGSNCDISSLIMRNIYFVPTQHQLEPI